jgi:protein arginine kinase activator
MRCERCQQNLATVHVTHIDNGEKVEHHLCEQCTKETEQLTMDTPISFQSFLKGLLGMTMEGSPQFGKYDAQTQPHNECHVCGMTYGEFARAGKFGCAVCYQTFGERLDPIFKSLHGSSTHEGKQPRKTTQEIRIKREMVKLKKLLSEAVDHEEFEQAVKLRDKIRELEKGE